MASYRLAASCRPRGKSTSAPDSFAWFWEFMVFSCTHHDDYSPLVACLTVNKDSRDKSIQVIKEQVCGTYERAHNVLLGLVQTYWLKVCTMARKLAAPTLSELRLISLLLVPEEAARTLIESGVRVTYKQIVWAAHQRLPGIEVWPRAHRQPPVIPSWGHFNGAERGRHGVESLAECICCGYFGAGSTIMNDIWPELSTEDMLNMLQLSANLMRSSGTDQPAASFVPDMLKVNWEADGRDWQITPQALAPIIITAVLRDNFPVFYGLCALPTAHQLAVMARTDAVALSRTPTEAGVLKHLAVVLDSLPATSGQKLEVMRQALSDMRQRMSARKEPLWERYNGQL